MKTNSLKLFLVHCAAVAAIMLLSAPHSHASEIHNNKELDSIITMLNNMPDDNTRLKQAYMSIQQHLNQYWTLDLIEYAIKEAQRQEHLVWEFALMGCRVRWTHLFHDWDRMESFLMEQREKARKENEWGNYISQIGQSAIVMAQMGKFEQSWRYINIMEKDLEEANQDRFKIYKYLVEADYYKYRGDEQKRLDLLLEALDKNIKSTIVQRTSLHIELIDIFGKMKDYERAMAHADSIVAIYDSYSPERKQLPQSRGNISEANMKKAEIYLNQGNLPMMKNSLNTAQEYANPHDLKNLAELYYWWAKYYMAVKDYARSLENIDKSIEMYREHEAEESAIIKELEKVNVYMAMGQKKEALSLYASRLADLDSVRNKMIAEQQEYIDDLESIISQRARRERMITRQSELVAAASVILVLIIIGILVYMIHVRHELKLNHLIIKNKLKEAKSADNEKEQFLRNITKVINEPLQKVVTGAKLLSTSNDLTAEEQSALAASNNEYVRHLLDLVNNVLDLSRLEAGMMKYATYDTDIVRLLTEYVSNYNIDNMSVPIRITGDVDSFMMEMDSDRMCRIVEMIFSVPFNRKSEDIPAHRGIKMEKEADNRLKLIFHGSLFANESNLDETELITNRIIRYILADFNSSFEITPDMDIVITLVA